MRTAAPVALAITAVVAALAGCTSPQPDDGAAVATNEVSIGDAWTFEPATITVANGTNVTWTNGGKVHHTVTFDALDVDVDLAPGENTTVRLDAPGRYTYTCIYHRPDMSGTVIVT